MPNKIKEIKDKKQQYNTFLNYSMKENSDSKVYGRVVLILSTIFLLFSLTFFILAVYIKKNPESSLKEMPFVKTLINKISVKDDPGLKMPTFSKKQTILLLGVDSNGKNTDSIKGTRSDTIILVNIEPHSKSVNMVSIPRDSKVYLADDKGIDKINAAHAIGGIKLTVKTIEETLGIKIDHYIIVNSFAVREIVDALDGVPVYVEKRMYYNDYAGDLHINLDKGLQVLNGIQAEGYLRFRHDGLGDIGRTSRQQWFVKGLTEKLQQSKTISRLPEIINIIAKNVSTDMSLYELTRLAGTLKGLSFDDIEVATLPGGPSQKGYISYWILDPEKTQEVIDRMIYRESSLNRGYNMVAAIMYTPEKEKDAIIIQDILIKLGFEVKCLGRTQSSHTQFIAHTSSINSKFVNSLKKEIPLLNSIQFVFDPQKNYCSVADFTIILSN